MENENNTTMEAPDKVSYEELQAAADKLHALCERYGEEVAFHIAFTHVENGKLKGVDNMRFITQGERLSLADRSFRLKWEAMVGLAIQAGLALEGNPSAVKAGVTALAGVLASCCTAKKAGGLIRSILGSLDDEEGGAL